MRRKRTIAAAVRLLVLVGFALLALAPLLEARATGQAPGLARQTLRPYWHVFIAYGLVWLIILGWVVSISRRLARLERELTGAGL
ncbi:MAG: CcmD family protein [Gemmatimonadetes bacterium]|nr:CcmD family protein [Gemmatimonadota bacterium]